MIISSWNVNSVRARIENIKEYLRKFSPQILMMQEIKTPNETYPYEELKSIKTSKLFLLIKDSITLILISFVNNIFISKDLEYIVSIKGLVLLFINTK